MTCPHKTIEAALDRWTEVHWHIHQIERSYHNPDGVRFAFNSLIRSAKEIPQILTMELQNHPLYKMTFHPLIENLRRDPLFNLLSAKRDFIVHRGMLDVHSKGMIGTTEGRDWKIGGPFYVHPNESSDEAYARFIDLCKSNRDVRNLLGPDCDSWPMLERKWCLPEFPDKDFLEIAVTAWRTCGDIISDILVILGANRLDTELRCAHDPAKVRRKEYSQAEFFRIVDGIDINTGKRI